MWKSGRGLFTSGGDWVCVCAGLLVFVVAFVASGLTVSVLVLVPVFALAFVASGLGISVLVLVSVFALALVASGLEMSALVLVWVSVSVPVWSAALLLPLLTVVLGLVLRLVLVSASTLTLPLPLPLPPTIPPLSLFLPTLVRAPPTTFVEVPVIKELMVLLAFGSGGGRGCMSLCWVMWTLDSRRLLLLLLPVSVLPLLVFDLCVLVLVGVTGPVRWW